MSDNFSSFEINVASAIEANLAAGGSARLVRSKGTFAPNTIPAAHPQERYTRDLKRTFPDTMSGTIIASGRPTTGFP